MADESSLIYPTTASSEGIQLFDDMERHASGHLVLWNAVDPDVAGHDFAILQRTP